MTKTAKKAGATKQKEVAETPEKKIAEISKEVATIEKQATKVVVKNQKDVEKATEFLGGIKARLKRIEELRTFFVKPLNDQVKTINAMFAKQSDPLEAVERTVKRAVADYTLEQHRIAAKEEARLAKLRENQNERRDEKGLAPILTPLPTVARPEQTMKTEGGKTTTTMVWKFEVQNTDALFSDKEFMIRLMTKAVQKGLHEEVVREMVKDGKRELKGVRIYEDIQVSVSAR